MRRSESDRATGSLGRREFLGVSAAGAAILASPGITRRASAQAGPARPSRVNNLIFAVSDGMSIGTLTLADMMIRRMHGRASRWAELLSRPGVRRALLDTFAADSLVTDSAAAATAWGIGLPVNNGSIGLTPDGRLMSPILLRAKAAGKATGLVTTTRLSHATPAGFIACIPGDRDDEGPIAEQILERGVDVMLGGGGHFLTPELIALRSDLHLVRTRDELNSIDPASLPIERRLLGVFAPQHMSYEIERPDTEPHLREMTSAALARLSRLSGGFVVQIEGGRVDHAAHNNDAGSLVRDQIAFDEALGVAIDFAASRDDTLLIVTTDHGNANPGLTEYGKKGNEGFDRLSRCSHSFDWINERLGGPSKEVPRAALRELVAAATGITLADEELALVLRARAGDGVDPYATANAGSAPLGSVLANHLGVAFLSPNHTCDYVEFTALGPGSESVPSSLTHAEVHEIMIRALDLPPAKEM